jgi:hypothetical protein
MTVLTSHDTLVVEGLVHHFCGLISDSWDMSDSPRHNVGIRFPKRRYQVPKSVTARIR